MKSARWGRASRRESWVIRKSFSIAVFLEVGLLVAFGLAQKKSGLRLGAAESKSNQWIEAQLYEMPEKPQLVEQKKVSSVQKASAELSVNPKAAQDSPRPETQALFDQKNETVQGSEIPKDHDPIPVYNPKPVLPAYLEYQDSAQTVSVVFEVFANGTFHVRLVTSSGNEEIDAVVLEGLRKWKFQPAVRDGKPVDSRLPLRVRVVPS